MTRSLEKMNKERKKDIFKKAEIFIKENKWYIAHLFNLK